MTTTANGFPTTPDDVTTAWLSKQLGEPVDTFTIKKVGQGNTADAYKLTYGDAKTVILKLPSSLGEAKQKLHALDCKVEVLFYGDFAPKLAGLMKLPKVYTTNIDPAAPHRWNILMEDLTRGSLEEFPTANLFGKDHVPDVVDLTKRCLGELAAVHGKFWQDKEVLEHPIFSVQEPLAPDTKFRNGFITLGCKVWAPDFRGTGKSSNLVCAELLEKFGGPETDVMKCKDVLSAVNGKFYDFVKTMHTPAVQDTMHHIIQHFESRPHTVLHCDAQLGNVFYDRKADEFTWIDFQFFSRGPAGVELVQASANIEAEELMPAFKHYYAELVKAGPVGLAQEYTFDDLWQDFRYMTFAIALTITSAYMPDIVPAVASAGAADPEGEALRGWKLRCARWGDVFDLVDIYSLPAEIKAMPTRLSWE